MMSPSRILPSVNFQPSSTHRTMPSSRTRLVEAIKKESAFTGWAPLTSTEREAASAANEQEDETNPKKLASPAFFGPRSPSTIAICSGVDRKRVGTGKRESDSVAHGGGRRINK